MTEKDLREAVVKSIKSFAGARKGNAKHKEILKIFNGSKLCTRYKMTENDAWCATTVSSAFIKLERAGENKLFNCVECSCNEMIKKAKKEGIWQERDSYKPKIGDIVMYSWKDDGKGDCVSLANHTGIITATNAFGFFVAEGNKNNKFGIRFMKYNARYIRGFITPNYKKHAKNYVVRECFDVVDISSWQKKLTQKDFKRFEEAGVDALILRCGYASSSVEHKISADYSFSDFVKKAEKAKLPFGVYFYAGAKTKQEAEKEAETVLSLIKDKEICYPVFYDVEENKNILKLTNKKLDDVIDAFCCKIEAAGYEAGVYASASVARNRLSVKALKRALWLAQYNDICTYKGDKIGWQYTSDRHIKNINMRLDTSRFYIAPYKNEPQKIEVKNTFLLPNLPAKCYFSYGDNSQKVKLLQSAINALGIAELKVDGEYGKLTEAAVKKLQKKAGLKADGVWGKKTQARVKEIRKEAGKGGA